MAQIIWTEPALSDLNEIAEYIAIDKPRHQPYIEKHRCKINSVITWLDIY